MHLVPLREEGGWVGRRREDGWGGGKRVRVYDTHSSGGRGDG